MSADLLAFISQDDFGCLDFNDVALLDEAQRQAVVECMDRLLGHLFKAIHYQHIVRPKNVAFRKDFWAWGYSRLTEATPDNTHLDFLLDTTAASMEYLYPSACHQSWMCMGKTVGAIILADDLVEKPGGLEQFHYFSQRDLRGLPQPEGLCAALADGIKDCDEFYGCKNPRGGSYAVMGWLAGIDAFCEEARFPEELPGQFASNFSKDGRTDWSVEKLPYYMRSLTGLPNSIIVPIFKPSRDVEVPLDLWISGIPDLSQWICLVNDLFSFPKEVLALENFNYLSLLTRARRQAGRASLFDSHDGLWTFRDTLFEGFDQLISRTAALHKFFVRFAELLSEELQAAPTQAETNGSTMKTKKVDGEKLESARLAAKLWGEFRQGYIAWHINHPRYRLHAIRAAFGATTDAMEIPAAA